MPGEVLEKVLTAMVPRGRSPGWAASRARGGSACDAVGRWLPLEGDPTIIVLAGRSIAILLVADNLSDARCTIDALRASKVWCQVTVARDGAEALAVLNADGEHREARCPDLVLLDLDRPTRDGPAVLAALRGSETLGAIPIVVLTGSPATEALVRSWALEVDGYLQKPVDIEQVVLLAQEIAHFNLIVVALLSGEPAGAATAEPPEEDAHTGGEETPECSSSRRRPARMRWHPTNNGAVGWSSSRRPTRRSHRRGSTGPP
jgi:CheY-like chemotaxis protein